jgi:hypothetical protein
MVTRTVVALVGSAALLGGAFVPTATSAPSDHGPQARRISVAVSATPVVVDTPATVAGKIPGPKKRRVFLEIQVPGGWQVIDKAKTQGNRSVTFSAPTYWYGHHVLRVRAPAVKKGRSTKSAVVSKPVAVDVTYEYAPVGDPADYELFFKNARWNPCNPISWRYNPTHGFEGSIDVLERALQQVTRATGLQFRYAGTTTKVPYVDNVKGVADLVVGWANEAQADELLFSTAGYGGVKSSGPSFKEQEYGQGTVVLDYEETQIEPSYSPSSPSATAWGQIMLHELGHAVGLSHASGADEMMYPDANAAAFGQGDLAGFRLVGASGGCWDKGAR